MTSLKNILLFFKYGQKATSNTYVNYLRKKGIRIGENTTFYSPWTISVDIQRPWMIDIGENVHITRNCQILQHGYDWSVLQRLYGEVLGSAGTVKIGNNVFIGTGTTILKGTEIGDNTIIGAGSIVNKKLEGNAVYAGAPVKYICSIEEYYEKRKKKQLEEAKQIVCEYKKKNGEFPPKETLREFFFLFEPRNDELNNVYRDVMCLSNNYEKSYEKFINTNSVFENYDDFLKYCEDNN